MPDPNLSMTLDDDLPRTVRRERDAREREARERESREREARDRAAREREAREASERAQRERERPRERETAAAGPSFGPATGPALGASMSPATPSMSHAHVSMHGPQPMRAEHDDADLPAPPATVTAFDVPFTNLMFFFLKAVIAGIPALLLMAAIMWGVGHVLQTFFPALLKLKIMIYVPQL